MQYKEPESQKPKPFSVETNIIRMLIEIMQLFYNHSMLSLILTPNVSGLIFWNGSKKSVSNDYKTQIDPISKME